MTAAPIACPAVAVAIALEELDRLKAMECLPTPEALLERLQTRSVDFDLLTGVVGTYLRARGLEGGCHA